MRVLTRASQADVIRREFGRFLRRAQERLGPSKNEFDRAVARVLNVSQHTATKMRRRSGDGVPDKHRRTVFKFVYSKCDQNRRTLTKKFSEFHQILSLYLPSAFDHADLTKQLRGELGVARADLSAAIKQLCGTYLSVRHDYSFDKELVIVVSEMKIRAHNKAPMFISNRYCPIRDNNQATSAGYMLPCRKRGNYILLGKDLATKMVWQGTFRLIDNVNLVGGLCGVSEYLGTPMLSNTYIAKVTSSGEVSASSLLTLTGIYTPCEFRATIATLKQPTQEGSVHPFQAFDHQILDAFLSTNNQSLWPLGLSTSRRR